jgi:hypothetical protein
MKPRAVVGKGTGALLLLSRLPIRLRDRMVKSALGLSGALNPRRLTNQIRVLTAAVAGSPVFGVPAGSISRRWTSSAATGQCSTPFGTT